MIKLFYSLKDINFFQLMQIYEESNRKNGNDKYPNLLGNQQLLQEEQDFYEYLRIFFNYPGAVYAVMELNGRYISALRLEPYQDGLLLEALETAPGQRRKGFASSLIRETLRILEEQGPVRVYSHVNKGNRASLTVHLSCGFERIMEHALYVDGSVMYNSCTLRYSTQNR